MQELLNSYNFNKKPINVGPIDFANTPALNADIHNHNRHLDSGSQPANDNGPINLQPFGNDYASPQRQNSRIIHRQPTVASTTVSPFLNPSYVTPRRQIEPLAVSSPHVDYPNQPLVDANGNDLSGDIPRNSQPRQRRPQRIESTTESSQLDQATSSRTRSPFSFVYNEPMLRNHQPSQPAQPLNPIYENVDESLLAITEPTPTRSRTHSNRQRGRGSASTSVVIEPHQPVSIENNNLRDSQTPRPRIRGSNRSNNVPRERDNIGNLRDPTTNVDGFFLYSTPTRSTRQPSLTGEQLVPSSLNSHDKPPRRNQNSRSRPSEVSIGNSYSVPARVTSLSSLNNDPRSSSPDTAPSSSSTRKRKPAKVRISTGFVVAETPASPGKCNELVISFLNLTLCSYVNSIYRCHL